MIWFVNIAVSFDGNIALKGTQVNLSSSEDWAIVHQLRNRLAAIVVGSETVLVDNPSLMTKPKFLTPNSPVHHPVRVVFDRRGRIPLYASVFQNQDKAPTVWVTNNAYAGTEIRIIPYHSIRQVIADVEEVLLQLDRQGDVMVEGGAGLINAFIDAGCVEKMRVYRSPQPLPDGVPLFPAVTRRLHLDSVRKVGEGTEEWYHLDP